jgi:dipeptidyl aminopeptidase/acylaminoacyl peptidase
MRQEKISIEDLCKIPLYSYFLSMDDDGENFVYTSNASGWMQIYLQSTEFGAKPVQITYGGSGVISPDGTKVAFLRDWGGDEKGYLFVYSKENGEIKQLTKDGCLYTEIGWNPNGKEITRTYLSQTGGVLDVVDVMTGEITVLEDSPKMIGGGIFSHNGKWIACVGYPGASIGKTNIRIVNRFDPEEKITYSIKENSRESRPYFSPDDKFIGFHSNATGRGRFVIQKFQDEEQTLLELEEDEDALAHEPRWSPNSDAIHYVINKHGRSTIHEHKISGEIGPAFPFPTGTLLVPAIDKNGTKIIALHSSINCPPGIYLYEIGSQSAYPLTSRDFNIDLSLLEKPRSIWYETFDNRKIHAWYVPAVGSKEKSPAVVEVHGGPWAQVNDSWMPTSFVHFLSQNGISWFGPNFRGSTGYGIEFQSLINGHIGEGDLEDVIHGAKLLRSQTEIDPNRIGIMGGSYGGFMTLLALTKMPNVFSTGVARVPITDWKALYEQADPAMRNICISMFGGTPSEKAMYRRKYRKSSPITYISQIKAPVMIMAGKNDPRCPWEPVETFVNKLKEMNHPHEFEIHENAGHNSSIKNVEVRIPFYTKIIDFLKKNL